jgi:hypothetical protein
MLVEVEGGKLKTVSGDKDNPDSQGAAAPQARFLAIQGDCCTPKFARIDTRIRGAA